MRSALKFLIAGTALVVIVGLGAISYFLFRGGPESTDPATAQPQAGQQKSAAGGCPVAVPASGYVGGNYVFRLSNEVFPPSPSLAKDIHDRYGNNAELADWGDLKAMLVKEDDVRKFISDTGIQLQSTNYDCDNILVSRLRQRNSPGNALPSGPARRQSASGLVGPRQHRRQRHQSRTVEPFWTSPGETSAGSMKSPPRAELRDLSQANRLAPARAGSHARGSIAQPTSGRPPTPDILSSPAMAIARLRSSRRR